MFESFEADGGDGVEPEVGVVFHALESLLVAVLIGDQDVQDVVVAVVEVSVELFALPMQVLVKFFELGLFVLVVLHLSEEVESDPLLIWRALFFLR